MGGVAKNMYVSQVGVCQHGRTFSKRQIGTPMFAIAQQLVHLFQGGGQNLRCTPRIGSRHMRTGGFRLCHLSMVLCWAALSGCSSVPVDRGGMFDRTLYVLGLQRADALSLQAQRNPSPQLPHSGPQQIALRLHAGQVLNVNEQGQSLSVVVRLFRLSERTAFEQAPYAAFQKSDAGHYTELFSDILESRELVLTPGQKYEVVETLGSDVRYLAVAVLFRQPAEQRWRFIFDAKAAVTTGITLGLHGCAVSVSAGQPLDLPIEMMRVAGVRCEPPPA